MQCMLNSTSGPLPSGFSLCRHFIGIGVLSTRMTVYRVHHTPWNWSKTAVGRHARAASVPSQRASSPAPSLYLLINSFFFLFFYQFTWFCLVFSFNPFPKWHQASPHSYLTSAHKSMAVLLQGQVSHSPRRDSTLPPLLSCPLILLLRGYLDVRVCLCVCGQRTTHRSRFFPSTMWVPGISFRSSGIVTKTFTC